jgi:hypothetical protein
LPDNILEGGFSAGLIDLEGPFTGKTIQELSSIFRVMWTASQEPEQKQKKPIIDRSASTGDFGTSRCLEGKART